MSSGTLRAKKYGSSRKEKIDIQLTALIDIVVFLLVFLIQVVTISKVSITLQGDIELPNSKSIDSVNRAINIQINKNLEVFIENEKIEVTPGELWTPANSKLILEKLKAVKAKFDEVIKSSTTVEKFSIIINLAMDKNLEYANIKNLMDIASYAGLIQFKFIVVE